MVSSGETQNDVCSDNMLQLHVLEPSSGTPVQELKVDSSTPVQELKVDSSSDVLQQTREIEIHMLQSELEGNTSPSTQGKSSRESDVGSHISRIDQEGSISAITIPEEVTQTPVGGSIVLQSIQGSGPAIIREKVSEDGYHWRKYGQKHVKCSQKVDDLIRSYYKCTHQMCNMKKQLDISLDGRITQVISFGQHDHPKPQDIPVASGCVSSAGDKKGDESFLFSTEDGQKLNQIEQTNNPQLSMPADNNGVNATLSESNNKRDQVDGDNASEKRVKKRKHKGDPAAMDKPTSDSCMVVQTVSEVDLVNDGNRWRKYGQKLVKGNSNPRSYYRCSMYGCAAKKHVERAAHDPKVVITTYEGQHHHQMSPIRKISPDAGSLVDITPKSESDNKLVDSFAHCFDIVALNSLSTVNAESNEQVSCENRKLEVSVVANSPSVEETK